MGTFQVETSDTAIPLDLLVTDAGSGVTGLSPTVKLRRVATGAAQYLDWADMTFKTSGWTTLNGAMTEIGGGLYERIFSLAALSLAAGVKLSAEYAATVGSSVGNDQDTLLVVRTGADASSAASGASAAAVAATISRKYNTNRKAAASGNPGQLIVYDDDGVTPFRTHVVTDETGSAITPAAGVPARVGAGT